MMGGLHAFLLLPVLTCLIKSGHASEIIHGEKVPANSMLYMVSVQNNEGHVCGGFLVSEQFVITAAHCATAEPVRVVLGTHNLKEIQTVAHIERRYKPRTYVNVGHGDDIMILKLSGKAHLDNRIQTISLPASEINLQENQQCRVAGWGNIERQRKVVDELRMVDVSIITPQVCEDKWPGLPPKVICAGGFNTNKGFCQGDSGGPLVCNGIAVGVVSFNKNLNCDYPDVPNVYTDISKYLPWIKNVIRQNETKHLG